MKIMIETDNKEFIKALRAMAKIANVEVKSSKNKLKAAISEYESDKKRGRIKTYDSFEAFEKDL